MTPEAAEHLKWITNAKVAVKELMDGIKKRQRKLVKLVVKAFNDESESLSGTGVDSRDVVIGFRPCDKSPVGVCAYSDNVVSLPGQREFAAWRKDHPGESHPGTPTDVCLFCATPMTDENDERHLQALRRG
jgi:hypothetical protein